MDSMVRDAYVGLRKTARPAWNYAGRYVLPQAINGVGGVAVGVPFAGLSVAKTLAEHGLKSTLWVGKNAGEMGVKGAWWLTKLGVRGVEHGLKSTLWVGKNAGEMGVKGAWWTTKLGMHVGENSLKFGWFVGKRLPHWVLARGYNAIDNTMPAGYRLGNAAVPNLRWNWGTLPGAGVANDRLAFMNLRFGWRPLNTRAAGPLAWMNAGFGGPPLAGRVAGPLAWIDRYNWGTAGINDRPNHVMNLTFHWRPWANRVAGNPQHSWIDRYNWPGARPGWMDWWTDPNQPIAGIPAQYPWHNRWRVADWPWLSTMPKWIRNRDKPDVFNRNTYFTDTTMIAHSTECQWDAAEYFTKRTLQEFERLLGVLSKAQANEGTYIHLPTGAIHAAGSLYANIETGDVLLNAAGNPIPVRTARVIPANATSYCDRNSAPIAFAAAAPFNAPGVVAAAGAAGVIPPPGAVGFLDNAAVPAVIKDADTELAITPWENHPAPEEAVASITWHEVLTGGDLHAYNHAHYQIKELINRNVQLEIAKQDQLRQEKISLHLIAKIEVEQDRVRAAEKWRSYGHNLLEITMEITIDIMGGAADIK